ncbi:UDP-N-acetylmuramoylalanine--D-glutamate ligase [Mycobacterium pseudoshottsii JCM 15466]|nr:UDP-N-acetylmuramoylalanine--D-glutamate ligase [Mycobacterium pseudoshottsii JCM 15466]
MPDMLDPLVPGAPVLVAGARVTGRAVLAALTRFGAIPTMCDDDPAMLRPFAESGVATVDPSVAVQQLAQPEPSPESRYALVVTSPGFQPSTPVLAAAAAAGVPIWGDVELAWRLDAAGCYGPPRRWLVVTGTNGKTTTTSMLHAMLVAGQHRSVLCGNIGSPVLDVLEEPADLLAVELSSFQLRWAPSLRPEAGVVLNIAEDHLDWHGTMAAYTEAKARVLTGRVAVVGLDDSRAAALRDTAPAPVRVGFRIGTPAVGELGLRDGHLVDRAFSDDLVLLPASSIPVPGPVGVLDTLAAAALARAVGVSADAIADAVASFQVGRHRSEVVEVVDGITYVDDSKATNPHAAEASVLAYPRVVWVAGGLLKGASVDAEVARMASRLVGAVLIGQDRAEVAEALSRHAPDVPVVQVVTSEDADMGEACGASVTKVDDVGGSLGARVMRAAVAAARNMARSGDTVLLAPAGASFDQFTSYGDRGDAFAAAVRAAVR